MRVKRSLRRPIRKLTCCVSGVKERRLCAKPRYKKRGGGGGGEKGARGGGVRETGRNSQLRATSPRDPSAIHSYRADLEKERQVLHHVITKIPGCIQMTAGSNPGPWPSRCVELTHSYPFVRNHNNNLLYKWFLLCQTQTFLS